MARENGKSYRTHRLVINMKENTSLIKRTDMGCSSGKVGTSIRVVIKMMKETGTGRCTGSMDRYTKGNGREEYNMV